MVNLFSFSGVLTYRNLVHAVAGGAGNAFAITICYPLEIARTRLQVDDKIKAKYSLTVIRDIYAEEGIAGVYRGLTSLALSLFCLSFVYFFVFHGLKTVLQDAGMEQRFLTDLVFGILGGIASVFATNPLWVVNTRLKLQGAKLKTDTYKDLRHPNYKGIYDCLRKIVAYEGTLQLWSGTGTSLLLVSNPAIQFMLYEGQKRLAATFLQSLVLSGYLYFLFGATSKLAATLVTYPMQLIQTRIRAGYSGKAVLNPDGMNITSMDMFLSMYRGLESKISQTVLTAALMLLLYEKVAHVIFTVMGISP